MTYGFNKSLINSIMSSYIAINLLGMHVLLSNNNNNNNSNNISPGGLTIICKLSCL